MDKNDYLGYREVEGGIEIGFEDSQGIYDPIFIPIPEYSLQVENISSYAADIKLLKDGKDHDTIRFSWFGDIAPIIKQIKTAEKEEKNA